MPDKETFLKRLEALRLDPDAIEKVEVRSISGLLAEIPNEEGKRGSLQIYAYITTSDSRITPEGARKGLEIYGEELRQEAIRNPGSHPNIDVLEAIVERGATVSSHVIRRDSAKPMPLSRERLEEIAQRFGTPFILYDELGIRQTLRTIYQAFSWSRGFKEFFAVKACPNPSILEICYQEGAGADCSSGPELTLAETVGMKGEEIMFTSNNTPAQEFFQARTIGAIINFDDITHIPFFEQHIGAIPGHPGKLPELCCIRYNPGPERVGNSIIGNPVEAKYGMTRTQTLQAFETLKRKGVRRFGLHTMIASNELNPDYHVDTAVMLLNLVKQTDRELGIQVEFVNTGGGWGVNYKPEQKPIEPKEIGQGVKDAYERIIVASGLPPVKVFMENGRFVTGPHGWLVSRVIHKKNTYRNFVGVDACMADFMRPGVYGIYQHALIPGKENLPHNCIYDVVGGLCENNDKFVVQRPLPEVKIEDLFVLCDAGAHGREMRFNYNGKLGCKRLLQKPDGRVEIIARAETPADYFATLDFPGSRFSNLAKR